MTVAYIFPGQGSQSVGMGRELAEQYPAAQAVFAEADDALGFALSKLCFDGPAEALQLTENTQPAILATSIAALRAMETEGFPAPAFVAGHSLGEYSAHVAAGSLSLADAVRTVRARGRYMQEAVPVGVGAMAAILGADERIVAEACEHAAGHDEVCSAANINSSKQIVIAGHAAAVERAMEICKESGAKRAVKLPVSAPFHCALMQPAQDRLSEDLGRTTFADLSVPLVANVNATATRQGTEARALLVQQVTSPVRWLESVELLVREGIETFVEVGPGKVLCGLIRQVSPNVRCLNVEDRASLEATRLALKETQSTHGGN